MYPSYFANPHREFSYQSAPSNGSLRPGTCHLIIRQQPKEALVTVKDKEKVRKPVDPPPMLELTVNNSADSHQQFLQNPYLFVCVTLFKPEKEEPFDASANESLVGTLVSSLHRLKDISNKDGGFFVFGDISVKVQGAFRLCFNLYEFVPGDNAVQHLAIALSDKFHVVLPKDFKGLEESTYLSRAFSDQGVRLRLRKEPRGMMGTKRSYSGEQAPISNTPIRPNVDYPSSKKSRQDYSPRVGSSAATTPSLPYQMSHVPRLPYSTNDSLLNSTPSGSLGLYANTNFQYAHSQMPLTQNLGYTSLQYPSYSQRNVPTSSVDDGVYPPNYSTGDTSYLS